MDNEAEEALKQFFSAQKELNQLGIIHSRDYIGDIGRYLCQAAYDLELPKSPRQADYDGMIGTSKVQVRINNCPIGTPVRLAEPAEYDELIVVLGPHCFLRPENVEGDFIFYRFTRDEALKKFKSSSGRYIGGRSTFSQGHDKVLNLT
jgi:hypothetical protein